MSKRKAYKKNTNKLNFLLSEEQVQPIKEKKENETPSNKSGNKSK